MDKTITLQVAGYRTMVNEGNSVSQHWVSYCFEWGYADNHPNNTEQSQFKIEWAVDEYGNSVTGQG